MVYGCGVTRFCVVQGTGTYSEKIRLSDNEGFANLVGNNLERGVIHTPAIGVWEASASTFESIRWEHGPSPKILSYIVFEN